MNPLPFFRSAAACLFVAAWPLLAPGQALTAPAARIGDRAIHADYLAFEAAQVRIKALNQRGRPLRDYHLAKAQCWLDVSFHEYTRNDRGAFPQEALDQSLALVQLMEQNAAPLPMDTALVNNADRLRPDLWELAGKVKAHEGLQCVAPRVACAEVELVHAGNENRQQGWRRGNPYVQMAEKLLAPAVAMAEACVPKPVPVVAPPPAAPLAEPAPVIQLPRAYEFQVNLLFNHALYEREQVRAMTLKRLDLAIARAREAGTRLTEVQLVGHADRTGKPAANQALAQARVKTVRDTLVAKGVEPSVIKTSVKGEREPVSACPGKFKSRAEELECLLPNRRVEVNFAALRQP